MRVDRKAERGRFRVVSGVNARRVGLEMVVERYKSLADIERGFNVLKAEILIGPVYHRLPERIRAHAQIWSSP